MVNCFTEKMCDTGSHSYNSPILKLKTFRFTDFLTNFEINIDFEINGKLELC